MLYTTQLINRSSIEIIDLYVYSPMGSLCITVNKNEASLRESFQSVQIFIFFTLFKEVYQIAMCVT